MSEFRETDLSDDIYDLAPTPDKPVAPRRGASSAHPPAASLLKSPLPIQEPTAHITAKASAAPPPAALEYRSKTEVQPDQGEQLKNLTMPLWLLGFGVPVEIVVAFWRDKTLAAATFDVTISLIFGTLVMLGGVLIAVKFRGIRLGSFWTAVLRLAAISIAPTAVVALLSPALNALPFGGIIGLIIQFVLYFALLGALFDLDESDTWYCVCVIFVLNLAVYFTYLAIR